MRDGNDRNGVFQQSHYRNTENKSSETTDGHRLTQIGIGGKIREYLRNHRLVP